MQKSRSRSALGGRHLGSVTALHDSFVALSLNITHPNPSPLHSLFFTTSHWNCLREDSSHVAVKSGQAGHPMPPPSSPIFDNTSTSRHLALPKTVGAETTGVRPTKCVKISDKDCASSNSATTSCTQPSLQPRRAQSAQCAAIGEIPPARDGPQLCRHDWRRNLPRDDAEA